MQERKLTNRQRLDRLGVIISGLCLLHCVLAILLVAGLGLGSQFLLSPVIHKFGLVLAMIVAAVAIGLGALHHRRTIPVAVAMGGLMFMGGALAIGHGWMEAALTVIGVILVAIGHILNLRHSH